MGWLDTYLDYTGDNEAPDLFHLWSGIACVGHVMGRKVYMDRFYYTLFPGQIMVLIVSESAVARKTTAMNLATQLVEKLPPDCHNIIAERTSPARLLQDMVRISEDGKPLDAVGMICAEEMGTFFTKESFAETLSTYVTALNNAKMGTWRAALKKEVYELVNPCMGGLFATTPTGLADEVPNLIVKTGFYGRLIVVYSPAGDHPNDLVDPPPKHEALKKVLLAGLHRISMLEGPVTFTEEGKEWFRAWYKDHFMRSRAVRDPTGFLGRKHDHLLRVATVFQACQSNVLQLGANVLEAARVALDQTEVHRAVATSEVGVNPNAVRVQKLIAFLEKQAPAWVSHSETMRQMWRYFPYKDDLARTIANLMEGGIVEAQKVGKGVQYRRRFTAGESLQQAPESLNLEEMPTEDEEA